MAHDNTATDETDRLIAPNKVEGTAVCNPQAIGSEPSIISSSISVRAPSNMR